MDAKGTLHAMIKSFFFPEHINFLKGELIVRIADLAGGHF